MSQTQEKPKNQLVARKKGLQVFLDRMVGKMNEVATSHLDGKTLAALVYTEAARSPDILLCVEENPASVASTVMLAAGVGLDVSGPLGHFYLIPRRMKIDPRNKARNAPKRWTLTYIIGYKGLLELARRSDSIVRMNLGVVYEPELPTNGGGFHWSDEPPECDHPKHWGLEKKDEELVGAYAIAELRGGARVQLFLDRDEIDDRRERAQSDVFWKRDFAAMARKSAARALLNGGLIPLTPALSKALEAETEEVRVVDAEPARERPRLKGDALKRALGMDSDVLEADEIPVDEPTGVDQVEEDEDANLAEPTVLERIAELEKELPSEALEEACGKTGVNSEAELEGQDEKVLEAYVAELEKIHAQITKAPKKTPSKKAPKK